MSATTIHPPRPATAERRPWGGFNTIATGGPLRTPRRTPPPRPATAERRPWSVLAVLAVAQFMVVLDITIVNVALPAIGAGLDMARSDLPWVVTAYVLC